MFRREPIVEIKDFGARCHGNAPQEVSIKCGGPNRVTAAMKIQNTAINSRRMAGDLDSCNASSIEASRQVRKVSGQLRFIADKGRAPTGAALSLAPRGVSGFWSPELSENPESLDDQYLATTGPPQPNR
jgi:hypothetical protein